jgi:hypothetical protein
MGHRHDPREHRRVMRHLGVAALPIRDRRAVSAHDSAEFVTNLQATVATRADVDALREEVRKLGMDSATPSSQIGRVHAAVMGFNDCLAKVEGH